MKLIYLFSCLFSLGIISAQNKADCIGATLICSEIYNETTSSDDMGDVLNEVNSANSCFGNSSTGYVEINPVWYLFTTHSAGEVCVAITPHVGTDYDFGIYNLTNADCEDIFDDPSLEVACNFSGGTGCGGLTGAMIPADGPEPDCSGQMDDCLQVIAGETYAILVTNYTGSTNGYTIDFINSTAEVISEEELVLSSISSSPEDFLPIECGASSVILNFSRNILCEDMSPDLFTIVSGSSTYTVASIQAKQCAIGEVSDNQFALELNEELTPGDYSLEIATNPDGSPALQDVCLNNIDMEYLANSGVAQFSVVVEPFDGELIPSSLAYCSGIGNQVLLYNTLVSSTYKWYSNDGVAPANELAEGVFLEIDEVTQGPGTYLFYVVEDKATGCFTEAQEITIEVLSSNDLMVDLQITPTSNPDSNDGTVIIEVEGGDPAYQILLNGDLVSNGELVEGLGQGIYQLIVNDMSQCQLIEEFNLSVTGLESMEINGWFSPNPVHSTLFLTIPADVNVIGLRLFSSNGSLLAQFGSETKTIDFSQRPAGLYFLEIESTSGKRTIKLVHALSHY
ncbi:T9SS type A sorting domain-containing protein [Chitinophagales bacterium]|nr:T9SS type A sorting domain-containing protein [Chitinophagales bacterium]